jgi:hypothetical protein
LISVEILGGAAIVQDDRLSADDIAAQEFLHRTGTVFVVTGPAALGAGQCLRAVLGDDPEPGSSFSRCTKGRTLASVRRPETIQV